MLRQLFTLLAAFSVILTLLPISSIQAAPSNVPWQFIERTYSEAYGRVPDQAGWQVHVNNFVANGCNANTLRAWAVGMYTNAEFNGIPYDNAARVLVLYRGALGREPDSGGFSNWLNLLQTTPWSTVVDNMFSVPEFTNKVGQICNDQPYGWNSSTGVLAIPTSGTGFAGVYGGKNQADLQNLLNATPSGGTVYLAQKAVVPLTSQLRIPAGVTLATTGNPNRSRYALMGRLVRAYSRNDNGEPLIIMEPGSKLIGVWVDGRVGSYPRVPQGLPDRIWNYSIGMKGSNIQILNNRFNDAGGGTNVGSWFAGASVSEINNCTGVLIESNLVTSYANNHFWVNGIAPNNTDGITTECNGTTIRYNQFVDTTDVSIVVFHYRAPNTSAGIQKSKVYGNTIVNTANTASGGILADPLWYDPGTPQQNFNFTGTEVYNNLLWTPAGQNAVRMKIGLALGSRAWYGGKADTPANSSFGAYFHDNATGSQPLRANSGILIAGMTGVTVTNNNLNSWVPVSGAGCPSSAVARSNNPANASGTIQPSTAFPDSSINQCIGF